MIITTVEWISVISFLIACFILAFGKLAMMFGEPADTPMMKTLGVFMLGFILLAIATWMVA